MNPVSRLIGYANAWTEFGTIGRPTLDSWSLEQIDEAFRYANVFFAPVQHREEFLGAMRLVAEAKPRYVVEPDTSLGRSLPCWSRIAHPEATIVAIDLLGGDFGRHLVSVRSPVSPVPAAKAY